MRKIVFPPVDTADDDGLLAIGGDMRPETLLDAYSQGIFPWPLSVDFPLAWFSPDPRGVLEFKNLHIPRSLKKIMKSSPYDLRMNQSFLEIIKLCAAVPRKDQPTTWITPQIIESYHSLYKLGYAWCAGAWQGQRLVGGVYGVKIDKFRSGESMFTLEDNAGKLCLLHAIETFQNNGVTWLDTQMVTPVVENLGGDYIPRDEFLDLLKLVIS
jgi:leucyl/phenylalanyl-tRNA---protein transferase